MQNAPMSRFDWREAMVRFLKYMMEGGAVAFACALVPKQKLSYDEIILIAVVAAAVFSVIDTFAPSISPHLRQGAGFAMGAGLYGGVPTGGRR